MTTSEPTTGEIVEKLRQFATAWAKQKIIDDRDILLLADRLESQEREIERLRGENKAMNDHVLVATGMAGNVLGYSPVTICGVPIAEVVEKLQSISALTARAEQAERQRDSYMAGLEDALRQQY